MEDGSRQRAAAAVLRRLALDEDLKARVAAHPQWRRLAWQVAARYVAGERRGAAIDRIVRANEAGHAATVDFMGESTRDRAIAQSATVEFLELIAELRDRGLHSSISLDLSHLGSVLDRDLGRANVIRLAEATAAAGMELLISMEGHDRVEQILGDHRWLCGRFDHVGVTVQARLHRTAEDLETLLQRPGRIRLVKGAFETPSAVALDRDDPALAARFDDYTERLLDSGHPCSIATHDPDRLAHVQDHVARHGLSDQPYLVEMLMGLDDGQLHQMHALGHPTQQYVVYGTEWWLYICNRIAEDPVRLFDALVDAAASDVDRT